MNQPESTRRLGDFAIVRELGRGGMGVVYEARQVSLNRQVALKVLSGGLGLTGKAVQRFRREAEAAARLHHTNIVPIYATGEEDGTHFYAMELIEGPSLDHVIRQLRQPGGDTVPPANPDATGPYVAQADSPAQSPPPLSSSSLGLGSPYFDAVARMVAEVADALDYAHKNGVVHRDIKPSNLLLSPQSRLSINDFGLARVLEQPGMTLTGEFVGTPAYSSPEQITAGRIPLDHRTDIYSLGATLYELLTLQPPFTGKQRDQILAQIVQKEPVPPRKLNKKVPVDLETICLKALEKDPDRRYQSAGAMAEDLRRYVNRFAISARRAGPVERLAKLVRRRPALAASLACGCFAVVVATFFASLAYWAEQRRRTEQEQAQVQLQTVQRDRALENALTAAMSGDLHRAEKAISEAELHGALVHQVRMLRGQVALFRGDLERALIDLEQAVKLAPDSAATQGMLATAYYNLGDWERYEQTLTKLETLSPNSLEDYLFKGYAEYGLEPSRALQTLNEAVKRSGSPLARAIRAEVRQALAEDRADLEEAERALADVQSAKEYLVDNPYVLSVSVITQVVAANLYLERGQEDRRQAALGAAKRDAQALELWETYVSSLSSRWVYFEQTGQEASCFAIARRMAEKSDAPISIYYYALALYRREQLAESLQVLDRRKYKDVPGDYLRALILIDKHFRNPTIGLEVYQDLARKYSSGSAALIPQSILRFLGQKDKAVVASRAIREKGSGLAPLGTEGWKHILNYACGDLSESDYLKKNDQSKWGRCVSHYDVALTRLADGDRVGAQEHFEEAVKPRTLFLGAGDLSRTFLARMKQDPTWPPWIPMKP
jgi:serine/threonine protein kinase